MKLWQKDTASLAEVERFTVGRDREFDLQLAVHDVRGSLAHAHMLASVGLLTQAEADQIGLALKQIHQRIEAGDFRIEPGMEDVHSQIEYLLTQSLGDVGKKIHSARSRNDQVLVDIKLYLRAELQHLVESMIPFFNLLQALSEKHKDVLLPGYTHFQVAMPSSFGLWLGAYAEALVDDLQSIYAAYTIVNKNPLGSAAGYGSSFPINRTLTTELLGFASLNHNVVYAQMGRGKAERIVAQAMANVADTLSRLSMDACLFLSQNFGFISFPAELTTGSSIMPHKKNPDVFELIRAHGNRIKALPNEITMMTTNLPSGYHRDLQLLKEHLFPAFATLQDCISMASLMLSHMEVRADILQDPRYRYVFSVEEVNKLVLQGIPFRDAYQTIGRQIEAGTYTYDTQVVHTHEGSIGQLCTAEIRQSFEKILEEFNFEAAQRALAKLIH
jgi:argininosuccinate lyase